MIGAFKNIKRRQGGALLLELLIAISLLAIILTFAANAVFLSLQSNKTSGQRDAASALASASLEAVGAVTQENWQNIYGLIKGTQHYSTLLSGAKWILSPGDEAITLNGVVYTRYVTFDNVSRDTTTRNIETTYVLADDDPSTQRATVTVSFAGGNPVVISGYFFRWENKTCAQIGWTTGGSGNTVGPCTDTSYDAKDPVIDTTGGTLKLQL